MKRCPKCERTYADETLNFCLEDGEWLIDASKSDEPQTAVLPDSNVPSESATRAITCETADSNTKATSSAEYLIGEIQKKKGWAIGISIGTIAILGVLIYGAFRLASKGDSAKATAGTASLKVQPLTATGDISSAVISPDGKYLAYVQNEEGKYSLWTKEISTNSNVQVTQPADEPITYLSFTPTGDYIFYVANDRNIYRVPKLSGPVVSIISGADTRPSFSPDGKQFVFARLDANTYESSLVIANADGSGERKLIALSGHEWLSSPDWSPDGKLISCNVGDDRLEHSDTVAVVSVETGEIKRFTEQRWDAVRRTVWLRDMSRILFVGTDRGANTDRQVWEVSYPGGESKQITHDLADYITLSVTADSKTVFAVQGESRAGIWVSPNADVNKAELISKAKDEGGLGIAWSGDHVIYGSTASGASEIWVMDKDGGHAKQLTNDGISKYTPATSADGRYIIFISEKNGRHIWRINSDGSQPTQLTNGNDDGNPRISPDSKWVVYSSSTSGSIAIWRVPLAGGEPQKLTDFLSTEPDVSPDGKYISCFFFDQDAKVAVHIAIIPFDGGKPIKTFNVPQTVDVDMSAIWTPDGRAVTYIDNHGNVGNMWVQPIDGGTAKQITDLKREYIIRREWTSDGKQVAIVRGSQTSDVVVLTDF